MRGKRPKQVNVLASAMLTPGDIEAIKDWIEAFSLRPIVVPDIGDSLDGHLTEAETSSLTIGGTPRSEIEIMGEFDRNPRGRAFAAQGGQHPQGAHWRAEHPL